MDIANTNFKSFEYKAKLLQNTEADGANGILKNHVPLKYLSDFWRSLEMLLINCKVELKLTWTSYCVLRALGADTLMIIILIISFLLSKTQNYKFLLSLYL